MASAIIRGGESLGSTAAKGLSLVRRGLRVVTTTSTGVLEADRAVEMSDLFSGDPGIMVKLAEEDRWSAMAGFVERDSGLRARAVMVWLRSRASFRTSRPVRPVAPRRRICIVFCGFGEGVVVIVVGEVWLKWLEQGAWC